MKIAMIGSTLFHQGAEYVLATLSNAMAAYGNDVTVILSKFHEDLQKAHPDLVPFELNKHVKLIVLPTRRARESVFSLRKVIKEGNYDVVLSHSSRYTYTLGIISFLMRTRPVFIHVEHLGGYGTDSKGNQIQPHFSFARVFANVLYRRMDAQFAVSEGTSDAIARMTGYPRGQIYTVYNPVVDDVFARKIQARPDHEWLTNKTVPVVVAAGAFCGSKNFPLLIRAWAKVLKSVKARLIIFGEGGMRKDLEQLIHELDITDSVPLPGFTNNLPAAMKRADCFVVSSLIESFSIVLVEALASGVPVVSTNCPYGPPEILKGGKYGVLVKNNDADALADGIVKVLYGGGIKPPSEAFDPYKVENIVRKYESAICDTAGSHYG